MNAKKIVKNCVWLFLTLVSCSGYSQIKFEKGYFIDNSNKKTECLIKNMDWAAIPSSFTYKLNEASETMNQSVSTLKEFGVYNFSKYIKYTVNIDLSSNETNNLGFNKAPTMEEKTLFLKVLAEGKANLFAYTNGTELRYFMKKENAAIISLVYKKYFTDNNTIAENNYFKQQLLNELQGTCLTKNKFSNVRYYEKDLTQLVTEYNNCNNATTTTFEKKEKKDWLNLSIRPGYGVSSLQVNSFLDQLDVDFGAQSSFTFGVEAEFIMPFNRNKWGLIIEPRYQSFKAEKNYNAAQVSGDLLKSNGSYSSLETNYGARYYMFISPKTKLFISLTRILDLNSKTTVQYKRFDDSVFYTLTSGSGSGNLNFGLGIKFLDKFSAELKVQSTRDVLKSAYFNSGATYNNTSVILGYTLF